MKLVLADYFLGFATRSVSGGARPWRLYYESESEAGIKVPACDAAFSGDLYLSGDIKDIASTYYPAIAPYDTTDPDVAEYHVLLAKAAGIDGFMTEFTIGQEPNLLCLVQAACRYDFRIGVNWISQSHLAENVWPDRSSAIARAHEVVRWLAINVYRRCGVKLEGRDLMLIFLAHPREPAAPFDPFFSPAELDALKATAADAGLEPQLLVIPWEPLPTADPGATVQRVWDGYFPWVWIGSRSSSLDAGWTHSTTRAAYLERLREYYASAQVARRQRRIETYIGAVCPGFDDHKGQAWGEGLKRHLPRDGGQTLRDTWALLRQSSVNAGLIITWNDWVESTQIEPSLELGSGELIECAGQIAGWKGRAAPAEELLKLPRMLLEARRRVKQFAAARTPDDRLLPIREHLDRAGLAIAQNGIADARNSLSHAASLLDDLEPAIRRRPIHLVWEQGFDSTGIAPVDDELGFRVSDEVRETLRLGAFVGRLCFEYRDVGVDFVQVLVDAIDPQHRVIASFKKRDSGRWAVASLDLVNARFVGALAGGADLRIVQRCEGVGLRMLRVDGTCMCFDRPKP